MNELKDDIKNRTEFSKYLEYSFLNEAAESYLKIHRNIVINNNTLLKKWIKYSTYFTRLWLNYLDNEQLKKILSKKLSKNSIKFLPFL